MPRKDKTMSNETIRSGSAVVCARETHEHPWLLAMKIIEGETSEVTRLSPRWESKPRVRVVLTSEEVSDGEWSPEVVWEGFASEWQGAIREASTRESTPGLTPGWVAGEYEAAYKADAQARWEDSLWHAARQ